MNRREFAIDRPVTDPSRQCTRVVVELDHELLSHGLVLADTPGFGAAQLGEHTDSHEQAVLAYLQETVSQVFWVVLGEQGIGQREREFYDRFLRDLCDDIIVTRVLVLPTPLARQSLPSEVPLDFFAVSIGPNLSECCEVM